MSDKDLRNTKFGKMLTRNNKELRDGRALDLLEGIELEYKREIENMERDLKVMRRNREQTLDMAPSKSFELTVDAKDSAAFVKKDIETGVTIKQLELKLEVAKKQYDEMFAEIAEPEVTG